MIVCICNGLREREVRAAAQGGGARVGHVYARLGCKPKCGLCLPFARELIGQEAARGTGCAA